MFYLYNYNVYHAFYSLSESSCDTLDGGRALKSLSISKQFRMAVSTRCLSISALLYTGKLKVLLRQKKSESKSCERCVYL